MKKSLEITRKFLEHTRVYIPLGKKTASRLILICMLPIEVLTISTDILELTLGIIEA